MSIIHNCIIIVHKIYWVKKKNVGYLSNKSAEYINNDIKQKINFMPRVKVYISCQKQHGVYVTKIHSYLPYTV